MENLIDKIILFVYYTRVGYGKNVILVLVSLLGRVRPYILPLRVNTLGFVVQDCLCACR